jgi:hypothetical protein
MEGVKPLSKFSRRTTYTGDAQRISPRSFEVAADEWIQTLEEGRVVKFTYQELPPDGGFITAQIAGNKVVYSIVLTNARNPLSRGDVESHFKAEFSKK